MLCAIWPHYSLRKVKEIHEGVILLVKLQASACNLLKVSLVQGCFPRFLNCKMAPNRAKRLKL